MQVFNDGLKRLKREEDNGIAGAIGPMKEVKPTEQKAVRNVPFSFTLSTLTIEVKKLWLGMIVELLLA